MGCWHTPLWHSNAERTTIVNWHPHQSSTHPVTLARDIEVGGYTGVMISIWSGMEWSAYDKMFLSSLYKTVICYVKNVFFFTYEFAYLNFYKWLIFEVRLLVSKPHQSIFIHFIGEVEKRFTTTYYGTDFDEFECIVSKK